MTKEEKAKLREDLIRLMTETIDEMLEKFEEGPAKCTECKTTADKSGEAVTEETNSKEMMIRVTDILHEIGIPAHLKGYRYMREAIIMGYKDHTVLDSVTKILYPGVAQKFNTTPSRVERAIRNAIETTWNRCNVDVFYKYFGYTIDNEKGKPTNSEFIAIIVDMLLLEEKE